jgi:hypothetical protein
MWGISALVFLANPVLGAVLLISAAITTGLKVATVDRELAKQGKPPASHGLIQSWLDGRKARGQAPKDAKVKKYGSWAYAKQRWQAMWEDLGEKHRDTRAAYKKAVADAKANGRPAPPKPTVKETLTGWKWQIDHPELTPAAETTAGSQDPDRADPGSNSVVHADDHTYCAGCPQCAGSHRWDCELCPAGRGGFRTEADARADADKTRCAGGAKHRLSGAANPATPAGASWACPGCGLLLFSADPNEKGGRCGGCSAKTAEAAKNPPKPKPTVQAEAAPVQPGRCGRCGGLTSRLRKTDQVFCPACDGVHKRAPQRENCSSCFGWGYKVTVRPQFASMESLPFAVQDWNTFIHEQTGTNVCPTDEQMKPIDGLREEDKPGPDHRMQQWLDPKNRKSAPETGTTKENTMTTSTQQSGEVTGIPSAIHYAKEMAAAHVSHGGNEGFLGSLARMEVGDGDVAKVRAAMQASRNAGALWEDAANSIEQNNGGVKQAYAVAPDAANKQANTTE